MNFEPLLRGAVVCFSTHGQQYSLGWGVLVTIPYQVSRSSWSASGSNHGGIDRTSLQCC